MKIVSFYGNVVYNPTSTGPFQNLSRQYCHLPTMILLKKLSMQGVENPHLFTMHPLNLRICRSTTKVVGLWGRVKEIWRNSNKVVTSSNEHGFFGGNVVCNSITVITLYLDTLKIEYSYCYYIGYYFLNYCQQLRGDSNSIEHAIFR